MMRGFVYIHNIKKVYIDFFNVMNIIHNNNDNNNRRLQGNPHNDHICLESNLGHFEIPEDLNIFLESS